MITPLLFQISRELRTALDRESSQFGLTFPQASLLIRAAREPGGKLNELAPHVGTDNAGVTRLADKLESAGLVQRCAGSDRRSLGLALTEAGKALVPKLRKGLDRMNGDLTKDLSQADMTRLQKSLEHLLDCAKRANQAYENES
jgi:DNA-binding MarR family transcriptional regulator